MFSEGNVTKFKFAATNKTLGSAHMASTGHKSRSQNGGTAGFAAQHPNQAQSGLQTPQKVHCWCIADAEATDVRHRDGAPGRTCKFLATWLFGVNSWPETPCRAALSAEVCRKAMLCSMSCSCGRVQGVQICTAHMSQNRVWKLSKQVLQIRQQTIPQACCAVR